MSKVVWTLLAGVILVIPFASRAWSESKPTSADDSSRRGATVSGVVVTPEGQPVAGATVRLIGNPPHRWPARTDRNGRFMLRVSTPGTYKVVAEKPEDGYEMTISAFHHLGTNVTLPEVTIYGDESVSDVTVRLGPRQSRIVGCVRDAKTGNVVEPIMIRVARVDEPSIETIGGRSVPRRPGCFEVLVPPSMPVTVEVSAPGYRTWHFTPTASDKRPADRGLEVELDATRELDIQLSPASSSGDKH